MRTGAFDDLPAYLRPGDLLVGNDSRVIPARLHGVKATGGQVELFLLRPAAGCARATGQAGLDVWECLVGGKGLRPGVQVQVSTDGRRPSEAPISATILAETQAGGRLVAF